MLTWRDLKPREKLLNNGVNSLTDAELLAIFLRTGSQGLPVLKLAQDLLDEFGSLYLLMMSDYQKIKQHKGMGICKFTQLQAIGELSRRFFSEQFLYEDVMSSPDF